MKAWRRNRSCQERATRLCSLLGARLGQIDHAYRDHVKIAGFSRESPGGATLKLVIAVPEPSQIRRDAQGRDAQNNRELRAECFHRPVNPPASGAENEESKIPARLIGRSRPPRTRVRNWRIMDDELRRGTAVRALVVIE